MRPHVLALCLTAVLPTALVSQIPGLDQIFGGVRDVNTSLGWARPIPGNDLDFKRVTAINFEITLAAGYFPKKSTKPTPPKAESSDSSAVRLGCRSPAASKTDTSKVDSTKRQTCPFIRRVLSIEYGAQGPLDSTVTYYFDTATGKKASSTADDTAEDSHHLVEFEIGLSYGQMRGFHSKTSATPLTGTMTTLPLISTYAIWEPDQTISPYIGATAGLVKLDGATGTVVGDTSDVFAGSGSTYSAGFLVGVTGAVANTVYLFGEVDWSYLTFPSVQWSSIGSKTASRLLPPTFRANSRTIWLGAQIHLRSSKGAAKGSSKS